MGRSGERAKVALQLRTTENEVNPVPFDWKWGENEFSIVVQYTYLGVEVSKDCSRDAPITKRNRTGSSTRREEGCDPQTRTLTLELRGVS